LRLKWARADVRHATEEVSMLKQDSAANEIARSFLLRR